MSGRPRISRRECAKALKEIGYYLKRQEGSHMIFRRDDPFGQALYLTIKNWTVVPGVPSFVNQVSVWMNS